MPTDRGIVRWVSVAVGALTAAAVVLPPAIYLSLSYQREAGKLEAEAEMCAQLISQIVAANPELWSYEQYRINDTLSRRPRKDIPENRRVLDGRGVVVAESLEPVDFPWITRTLPLLDAGTRVGTVELSRSVRGLVVRAVLAAMVVLPLSVLAFQILRTVPLRAIRRSEAALRRQRDRAQRYLDVAGVAFVALDAARKVTLVNRKGLEVLGRSESEVLGKDWIASFVEPADRARAESDAAAPIPPGVVRTAEYTLLRPSGDRRIVSWFYTALMGEDGSPGYLGSGVDITTQRMLEERLRHAQKLEAIGQLAAGVAHGFNNLLSSIKGYAVLLRRDLPASPRYLVDLDEILSATERGMGLTRSLLTFSRQERVKPERADVAELVRRTYRLLRPAIRDDIALETELPAEPLPVVADIV